MRFDLDEELTANPSELVGTLTGDRESEVFDVLSADQFRAHAFASGLYLS
jgi:hypothetical protein